MSVNIGINIQRSPNRINQQLREAGVGGKYPKLLLDFADNYYLANGGSKTLANAVTHARAGNATMTDGYGPELVVNGGFTADSDWTKGTGWSIANGYAHHASGANSNITQSIAVESDKAYIIEFNILEGSADFLWFAVDGIFTAVESPQVRGKRSFVFTHDTTESIAVGIRAGSSNVATIDNVSVREMPVLKWAPHNLLQYSEQFDLWAGQTNVSVTPNAETSPDGTQTADALVYSATNGIIQRTVQNLVVGASYTFSVWLKADSNVTARIGGFVSGFTDAVTVNVTTEWQQFYVEASVVQTSRYPQIRSDGADTIYVWGAHVYRSDLGGMVDNPDQPSSRASYVPTTSAAKYLPRVGHHVYNGGSAWVNEGVLAESEARTNLVTYSEDFTDSSWTKSASSVTKKTGIVAPDGSENVYHFQEDTNNTQHQLTTNLTAGTQVFSVFAKGDGSGRYLKLYGYGLGTAGEAPVFDVDNGIVYEPPTQTHFLSASIQDVGNGWYRCSLRADTDAGTGDPAFALVNATNSHGTVGYTGDGTSGVYLYGAQLEATSGQASSYIPTSGSSVTRAAETFTIPSANLPWPTPQSITGNVYSGTDPVNITGDHTFTPTIADDSSTKVVRVKWTQTINTGTRTRMRFRNAANSVDLRFKYYNGSGTFEEIIVTSTGLLWRQTENAVDVDISGITLEEINPLSVSIAAEGRMTYADTGSTPETEWYRWYLDSSNNIGWDLSTITTRTGEVAFQQKASNVNDLVKTGQTEFSPDILVPYNIASRHGSTFINGAVDGVALTANTTPTALPDLSSTDLELANDYMGTISEFRVWDKDLGDDGIVEATNPSLEPSLSLTFEGVGTNSFTVSDWSE